MPDKDVETSGPLFDARANLAMVRLVGDVEQEVADAGGDMVRRELDTVLRNPTGYYRSKINVERKGMAHVVTDGNVVYGPWLEGTGSRNGTTRFKGYRTFRKIKDRLSANPVPYTRAAVREYLRRMN